MKKIDLAAAPVHRGTRYPAPFDAPCRGRERRPLGDAAGLSQFGVNLLRLPPGTWSSQRPGTRRRTSSPTCSRAKWCW